MIALLLHRPACPACSALEEALDASTLDGRFIALGRATWRDRLDPTAPLSGFFALVAELRASLVRAGALPSVDTVGVTASSPASAPAPTLPPGTAPPLACSSVAAAELGAGPSSSAPSADMTTMAPPPPLRVEMPLDGRPTDLLTGPVRTAWLPILSTETAPRFTSGVAENGLVLTRLPVTDRLYDQDARHPDPHALPSGVGPQRRAHISRGAAAAARRSKKSGSAGDDDAAEGATAAGAVPTGPLFLLAGVYPPGGGRIGAELLIALPEVPISDFPDARPLLRVRFDPMVVNDREWVSGDLNQGSIHMRASFGGQFPDNVELRSAS